MIKIGFMDYANVYPIFYHLLNRPNLEFVTGYPNDLNIAIRNNQIDISPASSIEFIRNYDKYLIIPDISISSIQEVQSVSIFSNFAIEELDKKKIYFTNQSNTSTVLARIVLEKFYNINPIYITDINEPVDAKLLIGDTALKEYYSNNYKFIIDLGKKWYEHTSLPFVYALWIINREILDSIDLKPFINDLLEISTYDKSRNSNLIARHKDYGITQDQLLNYWQCIDYNLSDDHIKGLELFYHYASEVNESAGNKISDIKSYLFKI